MATVWRRWWPWELCGLLLLGCGDSGSGGGMAGAPAGPPTLGEACQTSCATGLFCSHAGSFNGQCTAGCGTDQSCTLIAPNTRCYGTTMGQCGKPCLDVSECPMGQSCELVANEFACVLAR